MFSQTSSPITVKNKNGDQLYYNGYTREIDDVQEDGCQTIYEPAEGEYGTRERYKGEYIHFVTNPDLAKKTYIPMIGGKNSYTARYTRSNDTNFIVKYTLDNRIYIQGKVKGRATNLTRIFRVLWR